MAGACAGIEHHARRHRDQIQPFEQTIAHLSLQHGGGIISFAGAIE